MPNADAKGNVYRERFYELKKLLRDKINIIENFGSLGYFSCMKHCSFMIGNSSSGIIEAASLNKWVINLGDRQKGRIAGTNVIQCEIDKDKILEKVRLVESKGAPRDVINPYDQGGAPGKIINYIKSNARF